MWGQTPWEQPQTDETIIPQLVPKKENVDVEKSKTQVKKALDEFLDNMYSWTAMLS